MIDYAKVLASSNLIPASFHKNPANVLVAMQIAQHHDLCPLMVMNDIYIIHGRPALTGKFVLALLHSAKRFQGKKIDFEFEKNHEGLEGNLACRVTINKDELQGIWVSMETARKEGWIRKAGSKWLTIPELMLRYRAATWFARLYAPEILMGFKTDDEFFDIDAHHQHHAPHKVKESSEEFSGTGTGTGKGITKVSEIFL